MILQQLAEIKKKFQETAQQAIRDHLNEFMKANPRIQKLGWHQYTPYFNDGEACVFRFHGLQASLDNSATAASFYDEPWEEIYYTHTGDSRFEEQEYNLLRELNVLLEKFEPELQLVFGDHTTVVVSKTGIETYSYDHD